MTLTCFASAETVKHERVYAVTNAAGDALTIIDNVRLENGDALTEIDDRTLLTALENVGGTEKFTQSGETVTWKADGNSIIYQGTSDKALNVTPVVHMTLDGKEVTAADVKNASGELVMTVSYRAESPFLAVTVMPLSDDVTSVTVDNGAVLTDGAHSFLMGFGIPGADADLELPDSFTMTAHVDHADLTKSVPGHPDIYMRKYNTAIFVHGCFWHRHEGCKYAYMPKSRVEFWQKKFDANIKRDEYVRKELMRKKVKVVIVWECTIKKMKKDEEFREDKLHQLEDYLQNEQYSLEI